MRLVVLKDGRGRPLYVNPEHVTFLESDGRSDYRLFVTGQEIAMTLSGDVDEVAQLLADTVTVPGVLDEETGRPVPLFPKRQASS